MDVNYPHKQLALFDAKEFSDPQLTLFDVEAFRSPIPLTKRKRRKRKPNGSSRSMRRKVRSFAHEFLLF